MHKLILDNLLLINHSNKFRPLSRSHQYNGFVTLKDFELPDDGQKRLKHVGGLPYVSCTTVSNPSAIVGIFMVT